MPNCQTYRDPSTPTRGVGIGEGVDVDRFVMCKREGLLSDESFYDRSQLLAHSHIELLELLTCYDSSSEPVCGQ